MLNIRVQTHIRDWYVVHSTVQYTTIRLFKNIQTLALQLKYIVIVWRLYWAGLAQQPWTQHMKIHTKTHHGQNRVMMQCRQWAGLSSFTRITVLSPISTVFQSVDKQQYQEGE